jgi:hypothetical protein
MQLFVPLLFVHPPYSMASAVYNGSIPHILGHEFACKSLSQGISKPVLELETRLAPKLYSLLASAGQCGCSCWPFSKSHHTLELRLI